MFISRQQLIQVFVNIINNIMKRDTKHFHLDFPLPKYCSMKPYVKKPQASAKAKNKHKLTKFTYYRTPQGIIKVLFIDDQHFIDQGYYPFTNPSGKIKSFKEFQGQVERIIYLQSVYICHYEEEGVVHLVTKKITEAKVDTKTSQIDTIDDNFEVIPVGNLQRWNQFLKVQLCNPNAAGSSIRIMIDEKFGQEKPAEVFDYEFFQREESLKKNRYGTGKQQQKVETTKTEVKVEVAKNSNQQVKAKSNRKPEPKVQTKETQKKQKSAEISKQVVQEGKSQQQKEKAKKKKR